MGDSIHKKKKDWPHFDKITLGGDAYAEGYDRIFGKKKKVKKIKRTRRPKKVTNGVQ